jgi:glycosyltransferase involved in cell wall biosynthesis
MKVLIATPLYPPEPGGPATYSKLLEEGLPGQGMEVVLVKFGEVRHLPKGIRHIAYFFRVLKAARECDVIYALDAASVGVPAMLAAKFARKPLAVKIVGDYAWEQGKQRFGIDTTLDEFVRAKRTPFPLNAFKWIQTKVARSAKRVIVPSAYLRGIVETWGIPQEKMTVIHNAIRAEAGAAVPPAVAQLPRPLVVSIGRLVPWKGFTELIEAVALGRDHGIAASLAIVGEGPDRAILQAHANARLGSDFVCTSALPHEQAFAVLCAADIFVLDSLYEGLSHTLVEACAAGVCIIASDIGGNREVIRHEDNGLLVPPGNIRALAQALERVLQDAPLRARLAASAKASAKDFSVDRMIESIAALLQGVAK